MANIYQHHETADNTVTWFSNQSETVAPYKYWPSQKTAECLNIPGSGCSAHGVSQEFGNRATLATDDNLDTDGEWKQMHMENPGMQNVADLQASIRVGLPTRYTAMMFRCNQI